MWLPYQSKRTKTELTMNEKEIKSTSAGLVTGVLGASLGSSSALCAGTCGAVCSTSALSIFGASTGTMGAVLSGWQPVFFAVSILAFGYAFYGLYFKRGNSVCDTDCDCTSANYISTLKPKIFLWLALVLSIGLYAYTGFDSETNVISEQKIKLRGDTGAPCTGKKNCSAACDAKDCLKPGCTEKTATKASCSSARKTSCGGD
jgi:hypothetical protein